MRFTVTAIVVTCYLVLLAVEIARDRATQRQYYCIFDAISNMANMVGYVVLFNVLYTHLFEPIYLTCAKFAPRQVPVTWRAVIICVIGADFVLYWAHRLAHGPLWPLHHPHHSSETFNLTTGLRQSWIHTIVVALYGLPFALAGISPDLLFVATHTIFVYSLFTHTRLFERLPRVIEYVFVTPSHHRVHHGKNPMYVDRNFGGLLIIWDRIFGTFAEETEIVEYGVEPKFPTRNPISVQLSPLRLFLRR